MKRAFLFAAAAAIAALSAPLLTVPGADAAPARKGVARDWTRTVVATPEGGFRMGNPAAAVKVVEFVSLTCSHCRDFAMNSEPQLVDRVRGGQVSYEIRSHVLNGVDLAATVLNRCTAPSRYFALNDAILREQPQWVGRLEAMTPAQAAELEALRGGERLARTATITGLNTLAMQHGMTAASIRACYADTAGVTRLRDMYNEARAQGVRGTPTFMVNGQLTEAYDWATLAPLLNPSG
jgi:protein-disulfide isomerase